MFFSLSDISAALQRKRTPTPLPSAGEPTSSHFLSQRTAPSARKARRETIARLGRRQGIKVIKAIASAA